MEPFQTLDDWVDGQPAAKPKHLPSRCTTDCGPGKADSGSGGLPMVRQVALNGHLLGPAVSCGAAVGSVRRPVQRRALAFSGRPQSNLSKDCSQQF
eukprot:350763-Chlamydomonas_euryale.AAC.2